MQYLSTRGAAPILDFKGATLAGLATDGGLYLPASWPQLSPETLEGLAESARNVPDLADRASEETDRALELRTRDRQRKLVAKIDSALRRIDNGEYGYCEMTGEPISLKRLDARPIATMTLEAQERHERRERVHRDD